VSKARRLAQQVRDEIETSARLLHCKPTPKALKALDQLEALAEKRGGYQPTSDPDPVNPPQGRLGEIAHAASKVGAVGFTAEDATAGINRTLGVLTAHSQISSALADACAELAERVSKEIKALDMRVTRDPETCSWGPCAGFKCCEFGGECEHRAGAFEKPEHEIAALVAKVHECIFENDVRMPGDIESAVERLRVLTDPEYTECAYGDDDA